MKYLRIEEFAEVITGGTPSTKVDAYWNGDIPWLNSGELNRGIIDSSSNFITNRGLKNSAAKIMPVDTVLIALTGATTGVVALLKFEACANQSVTGILPSSQHIPKYLFYYLSSLRKKIIDQSYGGAQKHISQGFVKKIIIPLPSLEDQKHIVKTLDEADALRQKRKQAIEFLDNYLKSVFLEMFGDPAKNPNGWEKTTLQKITKKITDGTHQSPKFEENGIPFIFISNIIDNKIILCTKKFIAEETYKILTRATPIEKYDILYTTVGSYGNPAIVETDEKFCFQRHIAHIKPDNNKTNIYFLYGLLKSQHIKKQADERAKGVAQKTLNLNELKNFDIILPPMNDQNEYAKIVQKTETLKQSMLTQSVELETQFQALMQKAFEGGL